MEKLNELKKKLKKEFDILNKYEIEIKDNDLIIKANDISSYVIKFICKNVVKLNLDMYINTELYSDNITICIYYPINIKATKKHPF